VKKLITAAALVALTVPALAQPAGVMSTPPTGKTIKDYYDQSVYNPSQTKIGSVDDILMSDSGQVTALIISVGGVAGMGKKDIAVSFNAVHAQMKDGKWYLTLNATEDQLKAAQGLTFDQTKSAWVPSR
jgi:sporulation protein YlmC with PRC-barrel domain